MTPSTHLDPIEVVMYWITYYYSVTSHKSFCGNVLWLSTGDRVLVIACVRFDANPGFARGCHFR